MREDSWREIFARKIGRSIEPVIILRNNHGLLGDRLFREMLASLATICDASDTIDIFRCVETNQRGKTIVRVSPEVYLPYSIQSRALDITLTAEEVFPNLNMDVIKGCGVETYDGIFDYCKKQTPTHMSLTRRQTEELVIRALFCMDLNRINLESCVATFVMFYNKHYTLPRELLEDVRQLGDEDGQNRGVALFSKIPSEEELKDWLSRQWQLFLAKDSEAQLNFADSSMLQLLPSLFSSGVLHRKEISNVEQLEEYLARFSDSPWVLTGLELSFFDTQSNRRAIDAKLGMMKQLISDVLERPTAEKWLNIAQQWGQLRYSEYVGQNAIAEIFKESQQIERLFREYVFDNYDRILIGSTDSHPLSVDRILPYLSKIVAAKERVALLVFDGMGLDQWEIVKRYLTSNSMNVANEGSLYAMIPTLTGYSRQAIFSGKTPNEFTQFKLRTNEKALFSDFWVSRDVDPNKVLYLNITPDHAILREPKGDMARLLAGVEERIPVLGIILTFIDKRLHGPYDLDIGKRSLYSAIQEFLKLSCVSDIFKILQKGGYRIFITSDHGNTVASGNGVQDSKNLLEIQGKRCLVYDSRIIAEERQKEADVNLLSSRFIPRDQYILFPNGSYFFGASGSKEIVHGGISIEEMIVPFVEMAL